MLYTLRDSFTSLRTSTTGEQDVPFRYYGGTQIFPAPNDGNLGNLGNLVWSQSGASDQVLQQNTFRTGTTISGNLDSSIPKAEFV